MAGDALPSMRTLAKDLRISVITTKRAYNDLEREGVIETITGKGSFVAARNTEVIREVIEDGEHSVLIVSHITSDLDKAAD